MNLNELNELERKLMTGIRGNVIQARCHVADVFDAERKERRRLRRNAALYRRPKHVTRSNVPTSRRITK